ncbi:MAG: bifunctional riboflavin kinase/FAD synthetase [Nitrospinota bacterium]
MKRGFNVNELQEEFGCCAATVGNFDGLHLGHRRILARVKEKSEKTECPCVLITFEPPPASVIHPELNVPRLTTLEKKLDLIEECGIDAVLALEFTPEFAKKTHKDFVREVLLPLRVRELYVGHDFHFGAGRHGNVDALAQEGKKHGFGVYEIEEVYEEGEPVRSTAIRALLKKGDVEKAARLLGRPYSIGGAVVRGAGRGKPIGFPTCNIEQPPEAVPGPGIYATRTKLRGKLYDSASHVGSVPTFDVEKPSIESYILDFSQDIEGQEIEIHFYKKLRDIVKFDSAESLARQIKADVEATREILRWTA